MEFDNRLVQAAQEFGVDTRFGYRAVSTESQSDSRSVTFELGEAQGTTLQAQHVIVADGAYSRLRTILGIPKPSDHTTHIATRAYAAATYDQIRPDGLLALRIDFEKYLLPAYGWVFPTSQSTVNVGVGLPLDIYKKKKVNIHDLLDTYIAGLPQRGIHLSAVENRLGHQLPHFGNMPTLSHTRATLLGDAGSMINPLSGEGIAYGVAAADSLATFLTANSSGLVPPVAHTWERQFRRSLYAHMRSCWVSHRMMRSERWARMVTMAAARDEDVIGDAALMLFGSDRMHAGTAAKIVWHGGSRALSK
jgi:flavin-dependent dehydrogenase